VERSGRKTLATELRHRVTVKTCGRTADGEGGFTRAYSTAGTYWASISPIRATQVWEYRSINVEATHLVSLRGAATIGETDQIVYGTRVFEVLTVENIQERDVVQVCTCKEVRA